MFSKFSVKKPFTVLVGVVLVIVLGVVAFTNMTPDLLPEMDIPYAVIVTSYAGASSETVEMEVTGPIEQAMATLDNIKSIESTSSENSSMVTLEFADSVNMDVIGVDIREKINLLQGYWNENVGTPFIMKLNPSMIPVTVAAVDMRGMDTIDLSEYVDNRLLSRFEGVEGVASVSVSGNIRQNIDVTLRQDKIDEINRKLSDSIIERFTEAKDELESGLGQATYALENMDMMKLAAGGAEVEVVGQLASSQIQLVAGRQEMRLRAGTARQTIEANNAFIAASETRITEIDERIAEIDDVLPATSDPDEQAALQQERAELEIEKSDLAAQIPLRQADTAAQRQILAALTSQITSVDTALADLTAQQQAVIAKGMTDVQAIGKMEVQLNQTVNTLASALAQVESSESAALKAADLTGIITMDTVSAILAAQNLSMPAGYVSENGEDYLVRVGDKIEDFDELKSLLLMDFGQEGIDPIYLRDVADVELADNADTTYAKINGRDGVLLSFQKQSNYATSEVSGNINEMIDTLKSEVEGLEITKLMDQGDYIGVVVNTVLDNLLMGAILAVVILFLFLRDIRPTFIVACSIPVSVTFAIVLMYFSGVTLNVISLAGLAVGVGMLVDNSIVVIENIYRLRSMGVAGIRAAVSGAGQVAAAITSSTLTTICVFFPIVFVTGITKQLFTDMVLTIAYSLLASLFIALTLIPAIAPGVLRKVKVKDGGGGKFMRFYEKTIRLALGHKALTVVLAVIMLFASAGLAYTGGFAFMPGMESTEMMVTLNMPEEYAFEDMTQVTTEIAARIEKVENVDTVASMLAGGLTSIVGLGGMDGGNAGEARSVTMYVLTGDTGAGTQKSVSEQVADILAEYPEIESSLSGAANMTSMMSAMGGEGITVSLYGEDLAEMQRMAREIGSIIENVDGVEEVDNGIEDTMPEIKVTVDKEKATKNGLTVAQVYAALRGALTQSRNASSITMAGRTITINVGFDEAKSMTPADIRAYKFTVNDQITGEEKEVHISDIASIGEARAFDFIRRSEQRRYIRINAAITEGYNVSFVTNDVKAALQDYETGIGYSLEYEGENETIMDALVDLGQMILLGIVIVYLIMVAQFQSLLSPFIVMFTIPLAFTGGFLALFISGMEISIVSMIGFVMLVGVIVNNGIVLIDYMNQLRADGKGLEEAIIEASVTRLRPVLMTALTTILGLIPLAIGIGTGAELMQPVAVVCIGGLTYATLMTLFIVPVVYSKFMKKPLRVVSEEMLEIISE